MPTHTVAAPATEYTIPGLIAGTNYTVTVRAVNGATLGPKTAPVIAAAGEGTLEATLVPGNLLDLATQSMESGMGTWDWNRYGQPYTIGTSSDSYDGAQAGLMTATGTGVLTHFSDYRFAVTSGQTLTGSLRIKASAAGHPAKIGWVWWATSADTSPAATAYGAAVTLQQGQWTEVTTSMVVPANTTQASMFFEASNVAAVNDTFLFDRAVTLVA